MCSIQDIFHIDIEHCPQCGSTLRVIACIETPNVIKTILAHLAARKTDPVHHPRAPPNELAQRAEPLSAAGAELSASLSPTVS